MVFFSHLEAVQQSHFDFKGVFAGHFIRQIIFFLILLIHLIFHVPIQLKELAIFQSISILIGTLVLFLYSKKYITVGFTPSFIWIKKILNYGGYIFGSGLISGLFSNLDQLLTSKFLSISSVAYYNTATRITGMVDTPSYAATEILFPKLSQASVEDETGRVKYMFEKMVSILLGILVPLSLFTILFAKFIILLIAGKSYISAVPILQLYMANSIIGMYSKPIRQSIEFHWQTEVVFYTKYFFVNYQNINNIYLFIKFWILWCCNWRSNNLYYYCLFLVLYC